MMNTTKVLKGKDYRERSDNQLEEWVKGNSIHNTEDDECCPDFSCCKPELLQPTETRKVFKEVCKEANEEGFNPEHHPYDDIKMGMLMGFLGNAMNKAFSEKEVYVTDGNMSHKKDLN